MVSPSSTRVASADSIEKALQDISCAPALKEALKKAGNVVVIEASPASLAPSDPHLPKSSPAPRPR